MAWTRVYFTTLILSMVGKANRKEMGGYSLTTWKSTLLAQVRHYEALNGDTG